MEIPETLRKAMELRGLDPDEVAAKAVQINEAGGVDAIPDFVPPRRPVDEPERDWEQPVLADFGDVVPPSEDDEPDPATSYERE